MRTLKELGQEPEMLELKKLALTVEYERLRRYLEELENKGVNHEGHRDKEPVY